MQTDTTWALFKSPFVISGQIDVKPSATLTVEPGVHVIFTDPIATIEVFGKQVTCSCKDVCVLIHICTVIVTEYGAGARERYL